jgi:hypothetical protein
MGVMTPTSKKRGDTIGSKGPGSLLWLPWFGGFSPRGALTKQGGKNRFVLAPQQETEKGKRVTSEEALDSQSSQVVKDFLQDLTSHFGMLFSPPPPLNFVMHSLALLGKYWLGSLKSLKVPLSTLTPMLQSLRPHFFHALFPKSLIHPTPIPLP